MSKLLSYTLNEHVAFICTVKCAKRTHAPRANIDRIKTGGGSPLQQLKPISAYDSCVRITGTAPDAGASLASLDSVTQRRNLPRGHLWVRPHLIYLLQTHTHKRAHGFLHQRFPLDCRPDFLWMHG